MKLIEAARDAVAIVRSLGIDDLLRIVVVAMVAAVGFLVVRNSEQAWALLAGTPQLAYGIGFGVVLLLIGLERMSTTRRVQELLEQARVRAEAENAECERRLAEMATTIEQQRAELAAVRKILHLAGLDTTPGAL